MLRFSANLGYLWTELPIPDAIRAAHRSGFAAVEFHAPYDTAVEDVRAALAETGLEMLGINTRLGSETGDVGLAAVPGRESEARELIVEAVTYASAIGADSIHVVAGCVEGPAADKTFIDNIRFAADTADVHEVTILIEPLNRFDTPGYFLWNLGQAERILEELDRPNVRLMFDCYHAARTDGDVLGWLARTWPLIGHIQFAGVPDRGLPGRGDLDYRVVFAEIDRLGGARPLGAEYRTHGPTEPTLGWMTELS